MATEKQGPRKRKATRRAATTGRKATTFRLDPGLQRGLAVLGQVLKKPMNRLVNEAVQGFIQRRSSEVEADLRSTLQRLHACRTQDPGFESAIAQVVDAEARLGRGDPMEGRTKAAAGPVQAKVRALLRG